MSSPIRVAIDVMGGDFELSVVTTALQRVALCSPYVEFLLFGDKNEIEPLLKNHKQLKIKSTIHHTSSQVLMSDLPTDAFRKGKNSSMRLAIDALAEGHADAVISAGNTGALMTMSKLVVKMVPGIRRPAMAAILPSMRGDVVLMDLGANVEVDSEIMIQFMMMGDAFAQASLGMANPSIGMLNIGSEMHKGNKVLRETDQQIRKNYKNFNYYGFIEGNDVAAGTVDVAITDGFTGNIMLKATEGVAKYVLATIRYSYRSSWVSVLGALLSNNALRIFRRYVDPRRYNGAIFLGLNGIIVKSHGHTDALGFANAVTLGIDTVRNNMLEKINDHLSSKAKTKS